MPPNNSPTRRAERRAAAAERNARPCVCCRACGRRHNPARACYGQTITIHADATGFARVLRGMRRRLNHWIRRHR